MYSDFMGFALDEATLASLRQWAERQGHPRACVLQGGLDMFARLLENSAPPKLVVVDTDGQDDPATGLARLFAQGAAGSRVIAVGSANDITLYRRLTQAGAVDYLVKPVSAEQFQQALSVALRGKDAAKGPQESRVIVVIGARGGVGASSLALNIGWQLAHKGGMKTALLDLDLQFGTGSLALDLEPARGLRDIVSSPSRVDGLMISSALMPESPEFSVLAAEEPLDDSLLVDGAAVTALVKELKGKFGAIVVDLPRQMAASQKRLLATAQDEIGRASCRERVS
jgi:pilus assembly protein CpaE